ncbi:hypothetical protein SAMN05192529_11126 [Arachidicoccus rhizosphaerae]|jgi:hypothetical protein|uniref:Uncharacterized protein n=1 Tax=Arachidicoccus rhizosphaerae TaxID=551991 RepID=A0A1H3ZHV7_9BACT|nr:hypothetical protein [Arachidicoccus rhizosphaerae]SEA23001.1 hypothetical protein SAMN05192529_11126 [Arachidicoccus rhizosphaerae]
MRRLFQFLGAFILIIFFMNACSKDSNKAGAPTLTLTPSMFLDFGNKDWNKVKPTFSNKKGYLYTEFSKEENMGIKSVMSEPVIIPGYEDMHYVITLNIARSSNKVVIVSLGNENGSFPLTQSRAYSLLKEFYEDFFTKITDTLATGGNYKQGDAPEKHISINEALDMIENKTPVDALYMDVNSSMGAFSAGFSKNEAGNFLFGYNYFHGY